MKINKAPLIAFGIWVIAVLSFWGLAFAPTSVANEKWFEQARNVCFGMLENGLPDAGGFMILILGPLLFLFAIIVVWPGELFKSTKNFLNQKVGRALAILVLIAVLFEATWAVQRISFGIRVNNLNYQNSSSEEFPDNYPRTQTEAPDFNLIDQYGNTASIQDSKGKIVILTFAFAHCQTICPTIVRQAINALGKIDDANVELLIITLDPWRDTPRSLPTLAKKWELPKNSFILSGSIETVNHVLSLYKIPLSRNEKNGDITHPALTYIIDKEGFIAYTFNNVPTSWVVQGAKKLKSYAKND